MEMTVFIEQKHNRGCTNVNHLLSNMSVNLDFSPKNYKCFNQHKNNLSF